MIRSPNSNFIMSCYTQYGNLMITLTQQTWTRKSKRLRNAKPFLNLFGLILSSENLLQYFQIRFRNAEKWKFFNLISQICLSSNRFLSFTDFRYQLYVVNWTPIYMSKRVISGSPGYFETANLCTVKRQLITWEPWY